MVIRTKTTTFSARNGYSMIFRFKSHFSDTEWMALSELAASKNMSVKTLVRAEVYRATSSMTACDNSGSGEVHKEHRLKLDLPEDAIKKIHCQAKAMNLFPSNVAAMIIREKLLGKSI